MNFLAHAYLSFDHPGILAGNMISDFVKGKKKFLFSPAIQGGMQLHRDIDAFTDSHPATAQAKEIFRADYRLYSGAIMDILYDHYLANDPSIFSEASLKAFSQQVYKELEWQSAQLPARFLHAFTYMKADDWLFHYRKPEGIRKSLAGLVRRAAYLSESETAFRLFLDNHAFLGNCYQLFFGDVKQFAKQKFNEFVLTQGNV